MEEMGASASRLRADIQCSSVTPFWASALSLSWSIFRLLADTEHLREGGCGPTYLHVLLQFLPAFPLLWCGSRGWLDIALFCPGCVLPVPSRVYSAQTRDTWSPPPTPFHAFLAYIFLFCF